MPIYMLMSSLLAQPLTLISNNIGWVDAHLSLRSQMAEVELSGQLKM
jgi:hypothetical protein